MAVIRIAPVRRESKATGKEQKPEPQEIDERLLVGLHDEPVVGLYGNAFQKEANGTVIHVHPRKRDRQAPIAYAILNVLLRTVLHDQVDRAQAAGFEGLEVGHIQQGRYADLRGIGEIGNICPIIDEPYGECIVAHHRGISARDRQFALLGDRIVGCPVILLHNARRHSHEDVLVRVHFVVGVLDPLCLIALVHDRPDRESPPVRIDEIQHVNRPVARRALAARIGHAVPADRPRLTALEHECLLAVADLHPAYGADRLAEPARRHNGKDHNGKPYMRRSTARHARIAPPDLPEHHAVPVKSKERHEHEQQQENTRPVYLPETPDAFKESSAEPESRLCNVLCRPRCRKIGSLDGRRHERSKDQYRNRTDHSPRDRLDEHTVHMLDIHPVPPEKLPHTRQEHKQDGKRNRPLVVEGYRHGRGGFTEQFPQNGGTGAYCDDRCQAGQQHRTAKDHELAREQVGFAVGRRKLPVAVREKTESDSARNQYPDQELVHHPQIDEGMHRHVAKYPAPRQEGRVNDQHVRQNTEQERGFVASSAFLPDDHGVHRGDTRKPGHQRGIFHGIPCPVAAERERFVGPVATHSDTDAQYGRGHKRPRQRLRDPLGIPALPERRDGKGERNGHQRETREKRRGVNDHPVILEQVVEPGSVRRYETGDLQHGCVREFLGERGEGRSAYAQRPQLQTRDHGNKEPLRPCYDRHDRCFPGAFRAHQHQAEDTHEEDPEKKRSFLPGPERRNKEMSRQ